MAATLHSGLSVHPSLLNLRPAPFPHDGAVVLLQMLHRKAVHSFHGCNVPCPAPVIDKSVSVFTAGGFWFGLLHCSHHVLSGGGHNNCHRYALAAQTLSIFGSPAVQGPMPCVPICVILEPASASTCLSCKQ